MICQQMLSALQTALPFFLAVHDINTSAINNYVIQWKMSFNPDPSKQSQEVIFFHKL